MSRQTLSRRNFLKGAGMAASATVLAACAPVQSGTGASSETSDGMSGEDLDMVFWGFATNRNKWYAALAERYSSEHPNVSIDVQEISYTEMHNKVATTLIAGTGAPDIADIEISRFGQYVKGDRVGFVPLNDLIADKMDNLFQRSALSPWSWQGNFYGLGNELNACLLFYRHDLLGDVGIETPFTDWSDFAEKGLSLIHI